MSISITPQTSKLTLSLVLAVILFCSFGSVARAATIELVALNEPQKTGIFPVFIYVDSENVPTIGTDLYMSYDASRVEFQKIKFEDMYPEQHDVQHDTKKHTIRFSGTNDYQKYLSVKGTLAVAYFKLLKKNTNNTAILAGYNPPIKIIWTSNSTNDTNVVSADGEDLVGSAPVALRIDPEFEKGKVKGIFTEDQQNLLNQEGVIEEVTSVKAGASMISAIAGSLLMISSLGILVLMLLKRKKNDLQSEKSGRS